MKRNFTLIWMILMACRAVAIPPPTPSGNYGCEITVQCTSNPNILNVTARVYRNCGLEQLCSNCPFFLSSACGIVVNISGEDSAYKGVSYGFQTLSVVPEQSGLDAVGTFLGCPNSKSICSNCGTRTPGQFSPGIEVYVFSGNISISEIPADLCRLRISWNTAFRSQDLNTISNPSTTGYHYYSIFNRCISPCNSLPNFNTYPRFFIPANRDVELNFGLTDPEGDSISYSFGTAYGGAGVPVTYLLPFSANIPFPFVGYPDTSFMPPEGMRLNPKTGSLQFRPNGTWKAPVVIEATQWIQEGNGVKKFGGMVRREYVLQTTSQTNLGTVRFDRYDTLGNHLGSVVNNQNIPFSFCGGGFYCEWVVTHNNLQNDTSYGQAIGNFPGLTNTYPNGATRKREDSVRVCFTIPNSDSLAQSYYLAFAGSSGECPHPATASFKYTIRIDNLGPGITIQKNKAGNRLYNLSIKDNKNFHLPKNLATWKIETLPGSNIFYTFPASSFQNYLFPKSGIFKIKYLPGIACGNTEFTDTILVPNFKINPVALTHNPCYQGNTGSLEVIATEGVGPILYSINSEVFQSSPVFTGLVSGIYKVVAKDSTGQQDSINLQLYSPPQLNLLATLLTPVKCRNDSNAVVQLNATGGVPPYQYKLNGIPGTPNRFNGVKPGTHTIFVTDSNGCVQQNSYVVVNPDSIILSFAVTAESCLGSKNGSAEILVTGGKSPYTIQWQTTPITNGKKVSQQPSGTVPGIVQDSLGCRINFGAVIPYRPPYENEQFCGVSVDTLTGYAHIIWNKTPGKGIAQYRIQRTSAVSGPYYNIKQQTYGGPNTFVDPAIITPSNNFYYRILVIDSCNQVATTGGPLHKPMVGGATTSTDKVILNWEKYQGRTDALEQKIWRKKTGSAFFPIATIVKQDTTFTDLSPGTGSNKYMIEIVFPETCEGNGIPTRIYSNTINSIPIGLNETVHAWKNLFTVFPNPGNGKFTVGLQSREVTLSGWELYAFDGKLMDKGSFSGHEMQEEISLKFPDGLYELVLQTSSGVKIPYTIQIRQE